MTTALRGCAHSHFRGVYFMDTYGVIYKITNIVNGKIYIGKTRHTLAQRWNDHKKAARKFINRRLCNAMNKYGYSKFKMSLVEQCKSLDELNTREKYYIATYHSMNKDIGYNMHEGGSGGNTLINFSPEERRVVILKRAAALRGRPSPRRGAHMTKKSRHLMSRNNARYWLGKHTTKAMQDASRRYGITSDHSHLYKKYTAVTPRGAIHNICGVSKFLASYHIPKTCFYRMVRDSNKSYRGWRINKCQ